MGTRILSDPPPVLAGGDQGGPLPRLSWGRALVSEVSMSSVPGHRAFWQLTARTATFLFLLPLANVVFAQPATKLAPPPKQPIANFVDIAQKAGLTMSEIFGGVDSKKYIIAFPARALPSSTTTMMAGLTSSL